jgi:hypothetical protein
MILSTRPRLGSWIGDTIARLDNFGTAICPTVATTVGSAYGIPVGAVGGVLPTVCKASRLVDPTHWLSVGLEHVFGTSSGSAAPAGTDAAALQLQAEHTRNMLLIFAGLAGAGVVGYLALRQPATA